MATVIVDELVRNGVDFLVLAPGSRSGALAMVAIDEPRLDVAVAIDERSAGFLAVGRAKATGRPAVVLTTSGTAVANVLPAVVEASESLTPLIVLSADRPFDLRYTGANQTIDQSEIFGHFVRFFVDIPPARDAPDETAVWRSAVCQAMAASANGPAHINVGFREPLVPASDDGRDRALPYVHDLSGRPFEAPWLLDELAPSLGRGFTLTGRDLVVAGGGADLGLVRQSLAFGAVVVAEAHSNCRVPGTITMAHHILSGGFEALRPERVFLLGRAGLSRPLNGILGSTETLVASPRNGDPSRRRVPMVDIESFEKGRLDEDWCSLWLEAESAARRVIDSELSMDKGLSEPRVARDVWSAVPVGGILVVGSSMPVRDLDWFAPAREGLCVVSNRGASGIDGFVSLAMGAAMAIQPAFALVGDLSLLHDSNGFLSSPRPDLTVVVINNHGGGIFSFLPQADFSDNFERVFATPVDVDFALLAKAHGISHQVVDSPADLSRALRRKSKGVCLVEVRTTRLENVAHHRRLTEKVVHELASIPALRASPRV
jgi:2-succinyl-5-enolpyruvyl-6-hydroxy-3-cyclohexene-1-carboxylate synthase